MDISFSNTPTKTPSLVERFVAAYRAFTMTVHPDMKLVLDHIQQMSDKDQDAWDKREARFEEAVSKLDPFDKSATESIAARTSNWHLLFENTMRAIEALETPDQLAIVRHMFTCNRHIVRQQAFRQWMARHADAIMDALNDEGH